MLTFASHLWLWHVGKFHVCVLPWWQRWRITAPARVCFSYLRLSDKVGVGHTSCYEQKMCNTCVCVCDFVWGARLASLQRALSLHWTSQLTVSHPHTQLSGFILVRFTFISTQQQEEAPCGYSTQPHALCTPTGGTPVLQALFTWACWDSNVCFKGSVWKGSIGRDWMTLHIWILYIYIRSGSSLRRPPCILQ